MSNETNPNTPPRSQPGTPPDPHSAGRQTNAPAAHDHESAPDHAAVSGRTGLVGLAIVLIAAALLAGFGILKRIHNDKVLADTTNETAAPTVIVQTAQVRRAD